LIAGSFEGPVTTSQFVEAAKTHAQAQEKQLADYSAALSREQVNAARESATAAKFAAGAAAVAALGAIAQAIIAALK
jgi:hypothetical protein